MVLYQFMYRVEFYYPQKVLSCTISKYFKMLYRILKSVANVEQHKIKHVKWHNTAALRFTFMEQYTALLTIV